MAIIVLKTINRCNSDCIYCFADKSGKLKKVDLPLMETVFERIKQYHREDNPKTVEIQWHGGEPLLLGKEFYKKVAEKQSEIFANEHNGIIHSFQSNLTLLTKEFLQVLRQLHLKNIGTSIDPDPTLRVLKNKSDHEKFMEQFLGALRLLEENKIGYGMNYVVTQKSLKKSFPIFYFLTNIGLTGTISVNPVLIKNKSLNYLKISPDEFARFIQITFPLWWSHRKSLGSMEPYQSLYDAARSLGIGLKPDRNYPEIPLILDSDGNFYHHRNPKSLGNIQKHTLQQMISIVSDFNTMVIKKYGTVRKCDTCELWTFCYCNTLMDAFSQNEDYNNGKWCLTRKRFMKEYLLPFLKKNNEAA